MKKLLVATAVGTFFLGASALSVNAFAQSAASSTSASKPHTAAKSTAKSTPHAAVTGKPARVTRRRATRGRAAKAAAPVASIIPAGAEKWSCAENEQLYITGNMSRDQILTITWEGKNFRLPREQTTTGADRFFDPASGMDLVVIPTKAMLFQDTGDRTRLADECKTVDMIQNNAPAPTQSNALRNGKQ